MNAFGIEFVPQSEKQHTHTALRLALSPVLRAMSAAALALCSFLTLCFFCSLPVVAQESDTEKVAELVKKGKEALNAKKYADAESLFTQSLRVFPNNIDVMMGRGLARYFQKNYTGAFEDMIMASNTCESCVRNILKTRTNERQEQAEMSVAVTNAAAYFGLKDYARAASLLARAEQLGEYSSTLTLLRGLARLYAGQTAQGCADCEAAAMVGERLVMGYARDTINKYCGNPIKRDPRIGKQFDKYDSALFANNQAYLTPLFPKPRQFYARGANDSVALFLGGNTILRNYDSAIAEIWKNGVVERRLTQKLTYQIVTVGTQSVTLATFLFQPSIRAELSQYTIRLSIKAGTSERLLAQSDSIVCGDVYVLAGQSNSINGRVPPSPKREFMRTYVESINGSSWFLSDETNQRFLFPSAPGFIHNRVGGLGGAIQRSLVETAKIPILLIQGSAQDLGSIDNYIPTAKLTFNSSDPYMTNAYQQARKRLLDLGLLEQVKGFIWYQGEHDRAEGYDIKFVGLYEAWRKEVKNLVKGYVVQIRPSTCGNDVHAELRETQRGFARTFKNVEVIAASSNLGTHDGCHYDEAGYTQLGEQIARLIARDVYRSADTLDIASPMIQRATLNAQKTELTLEFSPTSTTLAATADTLVAKKLRRLCDAFSATIAAGDKTVDKADAFKAAQIAGNRLTLTLKQPLALQAVSYLPAQFYPATRNVYEGPWLTTRRGVGASSFYRFPVTMEAASSGK